MLRIVVRFEADSKGVRFVRSLVRDVVRLEGGSTAIADDLEIVVAEILANAFEHADEPTSDQLEISLLSNGRKIEFVIHNNGARTSERPSIPTSPPPPGPRASGLYLVGQLSDEAEVIQPEHGKGGLGVRVVKYLHRRRRA